MDTLLKRIDAEQLAPDLDRLAGSEFLKQIRDVHIRYGEMVQKRYQGQDVPSFSAHIQAMGKAIVDHAAKVVGTLDEEDPSTVAAAREALRPLDTYREQNRAAVSTSTGKTPTTPPQNPPASATKGKE
jgi:hypothetical protein